MMCLLITIRREVNDPKCKTVKVVLQRVGVEGSLQYCG